MGETGLSQPMTYRMRAIITRGLYNFTNFLKFFQGAFFFKFWPYVWLVFKSGFKSRAGYDGARTVNVHFQTQKMNNPQMRS